MRPLLPSRPPESSLLTRVSQVVDILGDKVYLESLQSHKLAQVIERKPLQL